MKVYPIIKDINIKGIKPRNSFIDKSTYLVIL